jgi:hypothetical protein
VQVDPIKPTLKAPGSKRLKLEREKMLSYYAFKFNLRRYILARLPSVGVTGFVRVGGEGGKAGAHTGSLRSST